MRIPLQMRLSRVQVDVRDASGFNKFKLAKFRHAKFRLGKMRLLKL